MGRESQCQRVWHPGPLSLGGAGSQRKPLTQEQRDRVRTLERPAGCSGVSGLDLGRAAGQEVGTTVQTQGDGSHDVSLGARHLQGGSRRLSVPPGAPLPLGAALEFCSGEVPSIILLGSVVPLMLGQAGPIRLVPPGLGALGGGGWCFLISTAPALRRPAPAQSPCSPVPGGLGPQAF